MSLYVKLSMWSFTAEILHSQKGEDLKDLNSNTVTVCHQQNLTDFESINRILSCHWPPQSTRRLLSTSLSICKINFKQRTRSCKSFHAFEIQTQMHIKMLRLGNHTTGIIPVCRLNCQRSKLGEILNDLGKITLNCDDHRLWSVWCVANYHFITVCLWSAIVNKKSHRTAIL